MAPSPEALLISSVLRSKDMATPVSAGVTTDMFTGYPEEWTWLSEYYRKHGRVPTRRAFSLVFKEFFIDRVTDVEHYTEEVRSAHAQRELMSVLRESTELLMEGDLDSAITTMSNKVVSIAGAMSLVTDTELLSEYDAAVADIEARFKRVRDTGHAGLPTGFRTLDDRSGGPQPGDLWVVAGRLGEGKTWTLLKMAAKALADDKTVQYEALEQTEGQIALRLQALLATEVGLHPFDTLQLLKGEGDLEQYKGFVRDLGGKVYGSFYCADPRHGKIGPLQIAAQIERNEPDIVFVDYLTLLDMKGERDWNGIGALTKELKGIAMKYGVPIVVAAQLNRERGLSKNVPGAEALAQSDQIGQDADAVVTLKRESRRVVKFKMAKYRHGPDGYTWHAEFDPAIGRFAEVGYERACELRDSDDMAGDDQ